MIHNVNEAGGKESREPQDHRWMSAPSFQDINDHLRNNILDKKALKNNDHQAQNKSS